MNKAFPLFFLVSLFFCCFSCRSDLNIKKISTPCKEGGEPNLYVTDQDKALLSWVEYLNDSTDALVFSMLEKGQWSAPTIIAKGSDWFVNWADFPSLVAYKDNGKKLVAHWLQKRAAGTYDYDVRITQSMDGGKKWQKSFIPHTDGIAAEHGFVTMVSVDENQIFATWLDGRYTKTENASDGHDHEGQGGAMTLRGAFFDPEGNLFGEVELDDRVCDCCQTSAALTATGMIVAYRDRSEEEIRDIAIVRQIGQDWTRPRNIFNDNWEIAGCPVNGPKIIASRNKVAIAWFTMAQDTPRVQVAISADAGSTFSPPIRVDDGQPLGRVDIVFYNNDLVVSWLENLENHAEIRLARVNGLGKIGESITFAKTSSARSSGFPIMEKLGDRLLLAWTEIVDEEEETTTVRTALVTMR